MLSQTRGWICFLRNVSFAVVEQTWNPPSSNILPLAMAHTRCFRGRWKKIHSAPGQLCNCTPARGKHSFLTPADNLLLGCWTEMGAACDFYSAPARVSPHSCFGVMTLHLQQSNKRQDIGSLNNTWMQQNFVKIHLEPVTIANNVALTADHHRYLCFRCAIWEQKERWASIAKHRKPDRCWDSS